MTLAVDMRPIASLHSGLCGMATARAFRSDTKEHVSFNLHRHSSGCPPRESMMQSYYSIGLLEDVVHYVGKRSRLPNHTSVRCSS